MKRVNLALKVLWYGEEAVYAVVRERLKHHRDIEYLKMMEKERVAAEQRDAAIKERDYAIQTMHTIAADAVVTVKGLQVELARKTKEKTLDDLLSLHSNSKDDLPN